MRRLFLSAILLYVTLLVTAQVSVSPNMESKRDRKALLENNFSGASPFIVYELDTLSKNEFLHLKDKNVRAVILPSDTASFLYGHYGKNGAIQLWSLPDSENGSVKFPSKTTLDDDSLNSRLLRIAILTLGFPNTEPQLNVDNQTLSRRQFLSFDGIISTFTLFKPGHPFLGDPSNSDLASRGRVDISSVEGLRKDSILTRKLDIIDYRYNELHNIFGFKTPLILLDDKEITPREFSRLGEDSISLIGYYTTDFVKSYYGEKGKNGIVIAKTSEDKLPMDMFGTKRYSGPLELRNSVQYFPHLGLLGFNFYDFVNVWLSEHMPSVLKDVNARVYVSAIIKADGTIEPIIVSDVKDYEKYSPEILKSIVDTSMSLVGSMPKADFSESHAVHILFDIMFKSGGGIW